MVPRIGTFAYNKSLIVQMMVIDRYVLIGPDTGHC